MRSTAGLELLAREESEMGTEKTYAKTFYSSLYHSQSQIERRKSRNQQLNLLISIMYITIANVHARLKTHDLL